MLKVKPMYLRTINLKCILHNSYSNQHKENLYSSTVLLPKTDFPLRISGNKLIERDNNTNEVCTSQELYQWQRKALRKDSKGEYVLHDGPPYANGPLHMGHAINKVLKDIVIRSKLIQGFKIHYKPGWDCHGLPIELKAITGNNSDHKKNPQEIRETAREFATKTIENQLEVFKSWGILGDWDNPYKTYSKSYIKNQLNQFYKCYEKGLIYRDLKPVYWSTESRTALAEAELEFNEKHISQTVTVKFEINKFYERDYIPKQAKIFALIWTTTPWTLPSNQAIAFNSSLNYSLVRASNNEFYILASDLLQVFVEKTKLNDLSVMETFNGSTLDGLTYINSLNGAVLPFLPADHVSVDRGTGLVHTAPAHGPDDFLLALKYKIPIVCSSI